MDDGTFRQLLEFMELSWDGYRKVRRGVKKRLRRHLQALGCRELSDYLVQLTACPQLRRECERLLSVSISRFFRDRPLWDTLETHLHRRLMPPGPVIFRVWSVGCACGEEVYTFRILWERLRPKVGRLPPLAVTATDINPACLERARAAVYPARSLREVPEGVRGEFFETRSGGRLYAVKAAVREGIEWRLHHFLAEDPPGEDYDLIFLRNNLLTYYADPLQRIVLDRILKSLRGSGLVAIGTREKLPEPRPRLAPLAGCGRLLQKPSSGAPAGDDC